MRTRIKIKIFYDSEHGFLTKSSPASIFSLSIALSLCSGPVAVFSYAFLLNKDNKTKNLEVFMIYSHNSIWGFRGHNCRRTLVLERCAKKA